MQWLLEPQTWIAFGTLVVLELVLGVDNVIFISILTGRLPKKQQPKARITGLGLAVISRIILLFSISWLIRLTVPLFTVYMFEITGRDLILISGGLFLLGKSTFEIHEKLEGEEEGDSVKVKPVFLNVIVQIMLLDIIFSLDSVITAVGMVNKIEIMITAVIVAAGVMIFTAKMIGDFVDRHPTIKMLALAFLLLVGFTLVVEGLHQEIPKGYVYFAMAFSVFVEMLNLRLRKVTKPVKLRRPYAKRPVPASE